MNKKLKLHLEIIIFFLCAGFSCNPACWNKPLAQLMRGYCTLFVSPYKESDNRSFDPAIIRLEDSPCQEEVLFLQNRLQVAMRALIQFFNSNEAPLDIAHPIRIATLESGGGYRALLFTQGCWVGFEKIGLTNAITYKASISGSCWSNPAFLPDLTLEQKTDFLIKRVGNAQGIMHPSPESAQKMIWLLQQKRKYLTITDVYGLLLVDHMYGEAGFSQRMSDLAEDTKKGLYPLTIMAAAARKNGNRTAVECTPFEVTLFHKKKQVHVPIDAYGAKFCNGVQIEPHQELPLGCFFGSVGSAYAVTFKRWIQIMKPIFSSSVHEQLDWGDNQTKKRKWVQFLGDLELNKGAKIPNLLYGISEFGEDSKHKYMRIVDAHSDVSDFNVPYPLVTRVCGRDGVNVYFVIDAKPVSKKLFKINELYKMERYAQQHGLPFPHIGADFKPTESVTIFTDRKKPNCPVVIYISLAEAYRAKDFSDINDSDMKRLKKSIESFDSDRDLDVYTGKYKTHTFVYKEKDAQLLANLGEYVIRANEAKIRVALLDAQKLKNEQSVLGN